MKRALVLTLLLGAACAKREAAAPPPAHPAVEQVPTDSAERASMLDIAHGAVVTSRTGEAVLQTSALQAVDGDPGTFWMTPLADLPQSMTIALPARSRIDKIGIRTITKYGFSANRVSFESSSDGNTFSPMSTIKSAATNDAQWFDVKPVETSYIRVTMIDGVVPNHDVRLYSVLARGAELEPARPGDIAGCWSINGEPARFERNGANVVGILQTGREPMRFDGSFDGRIYRLSWIRGNDYGMALVTVSPDGKHLSGLNWHEEAIPMFFDTSWFGERAGNCKLEISSPAAAILQRTGRLSVFGRTELPVTPKAQFRFVSHEFRFPTAKENHDAAQRACAPWAKVGPCITAGSEGPRQDPVNEAMRALYSTVDLEIRR